MSDIEGIVPQEAQKAHKAQNDDPVVVRVESVYVLYVVCVPFVAAIGGR
jgi:hypothetical protein